MTIDSERPRWRGLRVGLDWTQQEMTDRIAHLTWTEHREHAGVNVPALGCSVHWPRTTRRRVRR